MPALAELEQAWIAAREDASFGAELDLLLRDFVGRPSPLYLAHRLSEVAGMRTCGCAEDCWCRKPGLDVFRWVVPVGHSSLDADEKAARAD